jgi:RHS repeat-associated protein
MPGRSFSSNKYRYGLNGMEKDDEIYSESGTSYNFGARIYDPRLARFLSLDPLSKKYPDLSPYTFAANMPIIAVDFNGEEPKIRIVDLKGKEPNVLFGDKYWKYVSILLHDYKTPDDYIGNGTVVFVIHKDESIDAFEVYWAKSKTWETKHYSKSMVKCAMNSTKQQEEEEQEMYDNLQVALQIWAEGLLGAEAEGATFTRRRPSSGDMHFPSESAARKAAFKKYNIRTSESNNFVRTKYPYGKGTDFEIIKAKDIKGGDVEIKHHMDGHIFKDNKTYELPHYHGPKGEHYTYPSKSTQNPGTCTPP